MNFSNSLNTKTLSQLLILLTLNLNSISYAITTDLSGNYYEQALIQFNNQENKKAILNLRNALQENIDFIAAHVLLGNVYLKEQNLVGAEIQLSMAKKLGADQALLAKPLAQLYLYQLKYSLLIKNILPEQYNINQRAELYVFIGHAYLQLNNLPESMLSYQKAEKYNPQLVNAFIGQANVLIRQNKLIDAEKKSAHALTIDPDNSGSWYIQGSIKHAKHQLNDALKYYQQAITKNVKNLDAQLARIGILIDLHKNTLAEEQLAVLQGAFPNDPRIAYLYSVILNRNGKHDKALSALRSANEILNGIQPRFLRQHAQTLMLTGLVNYSLKNFEQASDYLIQYIKQYPTQHGAYKLLSSIYLEQGLAEKTIDLLKPLAGHIGQDYPLFIILGKAYMQTLRYDKANHFFQRAAALNTNNNQDIYTEIGLNRLTLGKEKLAIEDLENAIKNNAKNTKAGIPLTILYLRQKNTQQALITAQAMQQKFPKDPMLLNLFATTQNAAGFSKKAKISYQQALKLDPNFLPAAINLSKLDSAAKNYSAAKQRLFKLKQKHPEAIISLDIELSRIEQKQGLYKQAEQRLQSTLKQHESADLLLALIHIKMQRKHYTEAINLAVRTVKKHPNNMTAIETLGNVYLANGNQYKATAIFENMVEKSGFNTKKLYYLAQKLQQAQAYQAAIKTLKKIISSDEKHLLALINVSKLQLKYGKAIFALNAANKIRRYYPEKTIGYLLLGDIYAQQEKLTDALKNYQIAFKKSPNSLTVKKIYKVLKKLRKNKQSIALLKKWIKKHPKDYSVLSLLAYKYMQTGHLRNAKIHYETLYNANQKTPILLNNLAYIYFHTNDTRAQNYAEQALNLDANSALSNDTLGWILVNKGQVEQGLKYLRIAYSRAYMNAEIRYHIGTALYKLQRFNEAKQELKQALNINKSFKGVKKARALLKIITKKAP